MIIAHQVKFKAHGFIRVIIHYMLICNKHQNALPINLKIKEKTRSGTTV